MGNGRVDEAREMDIRAHEQTPVGCDVWVRALLFRTGFPELRGKLSVLGKLPSTVFERELKDLF